MPLNFPKFGTKPKQEQQIAQSKNPSNLVQFPQSNSTQLNSSISNLAKKPIGGFNQKFGLAAGATALAITGGVGINQVIQDLQPTNFDTQPKIEKASQQLQKEQQDLVQIQTTNSQEINSQTTKIQETQTKIQTLENQRNELKAKFEKIKNKIAELNQKISSEANNLDFDPQVLQKEVQVLKSEGRLIRANVAEITVEVIKTKNELKIEQANLGKIQKQNSEELKKESSDVQTAEQNLQAQQILQKNQQRKIAEVKENLQKSQAEIAKQKAQKEQEVAKALEDENKKILEAQKKLAELVAQNQAKKDAAQNQLGQISQEKITQTSQLILKTFEGFGVKVEPIDITQINQGNVTVKLNSTSQNAINIAKKTIQSQKPDVEFEIVSKKYGEEVVKINFSTN